MNRWFSGLLGLALLASSVTAWSCCCIPVRPVSMTQPVDMTLPNQKALIYHEGDLEHLIISVQYSGASSEFAWIIPVENRPQVDVLPGAAFHELTTLTTILPPPPARSMAPGAPLAGVAAPQVQVLERKEAGPFDIAVLKSATSGGLYDWLKTNGFALTPNARQNIDYYVQKNWVFIAARIRPKSTGDGTVAARLQEGTIAPLHIRYKASNLSYPLHVTAVNPGLSRMDIYVVDDAMKPASGFVDNVFTLKPNGASGYAIQGPPGALPSSEAPTIRKLLPNGGTLHHLTATLSAQERSHDLIFSAITPPRVGER